MSREDRDRMTHILRELTLGIEHFTSMGSFSKKSLRLSSAREMVGRELDKVFFHLDCEVLAHKVADYKRTVVLTVSTPKTWWDHFKRDVLPRWMVRNPCYLRFFDGPWSFFQLSPWAMEDKVEESTVTFDFLAMFPSARVPPMENVPCPAVEALGDPVFRVSTTIDSDDEDD